MELPEEMARRLEAWARAYRNGPAEYRFPSDPAGEFFPPDLDASAALIRQQAAEIEQLREALKPFSTTCSAIETQGERGTWISSFADKGSVSIPAGDIPDDTAVLSVQVEGIGGVYICPLDMSHFRQARSAMEASDG